MMRPASVLFGTTSQHKNVEGRWAADKVHQDKAFGKDVSVDVDIPERLWGLTAGTEMWTKRKLGMELASSTSASYYVA